MSEETRTTTNLTLDNLAGGNTLFDNPLSDEELNWGNAKSPTRKELLWIKSFGRYPDFDPAAGKLSKRVSLKIADLKQATRIIVYYHYLHRGRTMAQLPYWIFVDNVPVGVILYSFPRLSVPLFGIPPMNLLELARMWLSPDVQGRLIMDSEGNHHALSVASCAVAESLRRVQKDWYAKYPALPDVLAIISWADNVHHEGVIYRACNFEEKGQSGGSMHGNRNRPNGGRDQLNSDYVHTKTTFLYRFNGRLPQSAKQKIDAFPLINKVQLALFKE
ncbi:MAG TPA: hypothetical protein VF544_17345 [Pyrinomonadaceae bacterium]|jgi:hypothetical protein